MKELLDLFSCQGGAARGYQLAGFRVTGVDLEPQPRYVGDEFHQADALDVLATWDLSRFAAVHASPPCQDHSTTRDFGGDHGTGWLLEATRKRLGQLSIPWVLENVQGSPLAQQPDLFGSNGLTLCGCMFPATRGQLYEDRLFETSFPVPQPPHVLHQWPQTKMGRPPQPGECMQVTGVPEAQRRMGCGWMTQDGLAQAIAPVYTEYIGGHLLALLERGEAA
jgi:DNA (cytosine-5)-methyltransferase 1